jgi:hypothetical protein
MTRQTPRPTPRTVRPHDPIPVPKPSEASESEPALATGWLFTDYAMI